MSEARVESVRPRKGRPNTIGEPGELELLVRLGRNEVRADVDRVRHSDPLYVR